MQLQQEQLQLVRLQQEQLQLVLQQEQLQQQELQQLVLSAGASSAGFSPQAVKASANNAANRAERVILNSLVYELMFNRVRFTICVAFRVSKL